MFYQPIIGADIVGPNGSTPLIMVSTQGKEAEMLALVVLGGADVNLEAWAFDDDTAGVVLAPQIS